MQTATGQEMPHDADDMAPEVWMMILIITEK